MLYRCRICGGNIATDGKMTVGTCDSCGTMQTVPRLDDERRAQMYERANHYIRKAEYDKATSLYEQILDEDKTDAEAYWSLVLCKYGVEYVLDPKSGKRTPTCNRAQFQSVLSDPDYQGALKYANDSTRILYQTQAMEIANIQKKILDISSKEKPYDVFISYKDKDANGDRTADSAIAQELYNELLKIGIHVFFARITLEDKVGLEYEPYIFAALNSAQVMIVVGTNTQNFQAPWVKNEWSRYLGLMKKKSELHLIPTFRNMDTYDLPEEFLHLQAVDIGKIGAMQDLVRGVQKLLPQKNVGTPLKSDSISHEQAQNVNNKLKRAFICIEDGSLNKAEQILDEILNLMPESSDAYIGMLLVKTNKRRIEDLRSSEKPLETYSEYQRALQYADSKTKQDLMQLADQVSMQLKAQREEALQQKEEEERRLQAQHNEAMRRKMDEELRLQAQRDEAVRRKAEEEQREKMQELQEKRKKNIRESARIILILCSAGIAAFLLFYVSKPEMELFVRKNDGTLINIIIIMLPVIVVSLVGAFSRNYSERTVRLADIVCAICAIGTVVMNVVWTGEYGFSFSLSIIALIILIPYFLVAKKKKK